MKSPFGSERALVAGIAVFGASIVFFSWALRARIEHGVPILSRATWEEVKWYFLLAAILIVLRVLFIIVGRGRRDSSEDK